MTDTPKKGAHFFPLKVLRQVKKPLILLYSMYLQQTIIQLCGRQSRFGHCQEHYVCFHCLTVNSYNCLGS